MREKKYWETWQRLATIKTFDIGYYNDYVGTVDIHTLDEQEKRKYGCRLIEAWLNQYHHKHYLINFNNLSDSSSVDCISLLDKLDR